MTDSLIHTGRVNGRECRMLLDTGCSVSLVRSDLIGHVKSSEGVCLEIMNGNVIQTEGRATLGEVTVGSNQVEIGPLNVHVVKTLPLQLELIVGLDVILRYGLSIPSRLEAGLPIEIDLGGKLGNGMKANSSSFVAQDPQKDMSENDPNSEKIEIADSDFYITFEDKLWTVQWKWKNEPPPDRNKRGNYNIPDEDRSAFDKEVSDWVTEGILIPWEESRDGELKNILPLMSVKQQKGDVVKIRPVLDFRYLNDHIVSRPGSATPLCQDRLREWRKLGPDCSVVDLRKAYLQIGIHPALWKFQGVRWNNQVFVLTRLGFGLNIAPKVMTRIVERVLSVNEPLKTGASSYIDDIFVNESVVSVETVVKTLSDYGLRTKPAERLGEEDCVRVLGLQVNHQLNWKRDGLLPLISEDSLTRRQVHKILGEWLGHYPVCGWLRVVSGYLQRQTAKEKLGWDDHVSESIMSKVLEVSNRLKSGEDPVRGKWLAPVNGKVEVWTDASDIAMGVVLTVNGHVVEDAAWLRKEQDTSHINTSELDAAIRGLNMAIKWDFKKFTIKTDSATVHGWLNSAFQDTHNIRTHALSELLIRRRIQILRELRIQENLDVTVELVRSHENLADKLTRVPKSWLVTMKKECASLAAIGTSTDDLEDIVRQIHERHHFGVDRTLQMARRCNTDVSRTVVQKVVEECDRCARVCPITNPNYGKGKLSVDEVWKRVSTDVTHVGSRAYLTVIDAGSRYCLWKSLKNETGLEISQHLEQIFSEFGPPESLLSDNALAFRSNDVSNVLRRWCVSHEFSCAYRPQGNGISERNHRTIKTMNARSHNPIEECVFWYNSTCKIGGTPPFVLMFHAHARLPGITNERPMDCESPKSFEFCEDFLISTVSDNGNPFVIGEAVYLRTDGRCDSEWSGPHRITDIKSGVSVEINNDGITRHISHVKKVPNQQRNMVADVDSDSDSDTSITTCNNDCPGTSSILEAGEPPVPSSEVTNNVTHQRSARTRRQPNYLRDYVK